MPRKARIDLCGAASAKTFAPGAIHHIVIRGIERKPIFKDSLDNQNFKFGPSAVRKLLSRGHLEAETRTIAIDSLS